MDDDNKSNSSDSDRKNDNSLMEEELYNPRFFIRNVNIDS